MESEGVSLPLIHEHAMVPWNHIGKGDCCGRFESITDGYFCKRCRYFVHKKCSESSEYIQDPSHPAHSLKLRRSSYINCALCGSGIGDLFYHCEICDFVMDLHCVKYAPPKVIDNSETHGHKLTLLNKRIDFNCGAKCGKSQDGFPYECYECDLAFHIGCVWHHPLEATHPLEYTTINIGEKVSLPWIHKHFMMPCNDMKKGDCCGRLEALTDGYYCEICHFFVHKKCTKEPSEPIKHPSHSVHLLWLRSNKSYNSHDTINDYNYCSVCGSKIVDPFYRCEICDFAVDLCCSKYPPPDVIDNPKMHRHKIILLKKRILEFDCDVCGKIGEKEFPYRCDECDLCFHVDCIWQPNITSELEVNHSYHPWHPLTLTGQPPEYSDKKCRLCERKINDRMFYHCSSCNFNLDMRCFYEPPPQSLLNLKAHDHQLTFLPRLDSFTCNACGLKGDRSPYICGPCGFMIHQDCLGLPRVININRHEHRISRTSILGVHNSTCGVCRKKVDWTYGGYLCHKCPSYVVHSKCATRADVWNGKELEGIPEEIEDIEPYVIIDENTIQHFSHKEHYLRIHVSGVLYEENKRCNACIHPVGLQSFYGCIQCVFFLHQSCAELPQKKWHVLHNEHLTLVTTRKDGEFYCGACQRMSNGFMYHHGDKMLDVRCSSISEPFAHPSHLDHPLYHIPKNKDEICKGCIKEKRDVLICIEDDCEFTLCFECATLPEVVKHRVEKHPLSLCYGGEKAIGKYWCEICERETNPDEWFYTCKDHRASLHIKCVLGDLAGLMPRSIIWRRYNTVEVMLNNSVTRPLCRGCGSCCMYPIVLRMLETSHMYLCSESCLTSYTWSYFFGALAAERTNKNGDFLS